MLTEEEMKVIDDLHYLLDLSGFSRMYAYTVMGTSPYGISKIKNTRRRQLRLEYVSAMVRALRSELKTGKYPMCVEHTRGKQIEQLSLILEQQIQIER